MNLLFGCTYFLANLIKIPQTQAINPPIGVFFRNKHFFSLQRAQIYKLIAKFALIS
jgi:hypothetical protein